MSTLTLIRGGTVWSPLPLGRQDVLLAGTAIAIVAEGISTPDDWPIEVIELDGQHVVPGLIDQHIHIAGGGGTGGPATANETLAFEAAVASGLTTVVGCLGYDTYAKSLRGLLAKCRALQQEGITALMYTGGLTEPKPSLSSSLAEDLVLFPEVVGIKGGLQETRGGPRTTDELLELAGHAAAAQLAAKAPRLHLHVGRLPGTLAVVANAIDAGLDPEWLTVTHANISEAILQAAIDLGLRGVRLDVTAALFPASSPGAVDPVAAVEAIIGSGVDASHITLSSDANGASAISSEEGYVIGAEAHPPAVLTDALRGLIASSGIEVGLPMLTSNVAGGLGLRQKGRLAPGADADVVVLSDGLEIQHVWARGVHYVADGTVQIGGFFDRAPAGAD